MWNLGWYWPESSVTYGITVLGLVYVVIAWGQAVQQPLISSVPSAQKSLVAVLCLVVYFMYPVMVKNQAEQADNHFVKTLRETETRIGRVVEFDRVPYIKTEGEDVIRTMSKEHLKVVTNPLPHSALVSIKGRFQSSDTVAVEDLHVHSSWFRDVASILGLAILAIMFFMSMFRGKDSLQKEDRV